MGVSEDIGVLPFVDEHAVEVVASPARTWEALETFADRLFARGAAPYLARVLGTEDPHGFHVGLAEPRRTLALVGRHRFSRYALVFHLDDLGAVPAGTGEGRTRLRAETRAEFPGLHGRAYRALVIGTRGHVLVTRRFLAAIKARAERPPTA